MTDAAPTNPTPQRRAALATMQEVADYLGVTTRTIRNYVSLGHIQAYRLPGSRGLRFDLSEVRREVRAIPSTRARNDLNVYGSKARIATLPRRVEAEPEA